MQRLTSPNPDADLDDGYRNPATGWDDNREDFGIWGEQ